MKTGLESLDTGASKITYRGNEGPKAPQQMAMADPMLVEQYQQYVFEMEEQGLQPMSFEEFVAQARAGMNEGGIARVGFFRGALADADKKGQAMSPGTSASGGRRGPSGPPGGGDREMTYTAPPTTVSPPDGPPGGGDPEMTYIPDYDEDRGTKIDPTIKTKDDDGFFRTTERKLIDNFVRRNKYKNLIEAGLYSDFPGLVGKVLGYMNPDEEVDDFDIDSIREIASTIYSGGGSLTPKQVKGLEGLRRDFEFEQEYPDPTTKDLREYYNLDDKITGGDDGPPPIIYPYPISTAMAPPGMAPAVAPGTAVATATGNPFLQRDVPFGAYGTAAHGAQFGVDPRMFVADGGRIGYAGGGIADLRQGYFLGKLVKKIGRGIKKVIKSPIGKAALLASPFLMKKGMLSTLLGTKAIPGFPGGREQGTLGLLAKLGLTKGKGSFMPTAFGGIAALSSLPLLFGESQEDEEGVNYADLPNIFDKYSPDQLRRMALTGGMDRAQYPFLPATAYAADGGRIGLMDGGDLRAAALTEMYNDDEEDKKLSKGGSAGLPPITAGVEGQASQSFSDDETPMPTQQDQMPMPRPMMAGRMNPMMAGRMNPMMMAGRMNPMMARGMMPRMMAQEGGLMDLGGMEKDYRNEGGFVPIGGQERADDVPARLSKNEFVFTADAVRAAGGGDIDKGAEVMENMMENLEKGGKVSEESQGLKGARDMFATAQRLEGVL